MSSRILQWRSAIIAAVAGCLILVVLLGTWAVSYSPALPDNSPAALVTPSRRTTYITEPLRADGSVDYLAALNLRSSKGVTPDNNASVLIWQALGPGPHEAATRSAFFKAIGMPVPAEKGDYFISTARFARQRHDADGDVSIEEEIDDQLYTATTRAWETDEFPLVATWLQANEEPLRLAIEATQRSRRFDPLVVLHNVPGQLLAMDLPMATESRSITRALVARAMLRLKQGQIDEAWQDLLAVHRLSRLVAQGPTLVEGLIEVAIDGQACAGERAILQFAELKPEQISRMRAELEELSPLASLVERLNIGDRYMCLDSIYSMAGEMSGHTAAGEHFDPILQRALKSLGGFQVDWNLVFARINSRWDRYIAACRLPTRTTRKAAFDGLEQEIRQAKGVITPFATSFVSSKGVSERMADLMIALMAHRGSDHLRRRRSRKNGIGSDEVGVCLSPLSREPRCVSRIGRLARS